MGAKERRLITNTSKMTTQKVEIVDLKEGFRKKAIRATTYVFFGVSEEDVEDAVVVTREHFMARITEIKEKQRAKIQKGRQRTQDDTISKLDAVQVDSHAQFSWLLQVPPSSRESASQSSEFYDITQLQHPNTTTQSDPFSDVAFPNKKQKVVVSSDEFLAISSDAQIIGSEF